MALALAALAYLLAAAPAQGASGAWERAWGKDVDASRPGTGFEICTVAANCKAGATGTLGGEFSDASGIAVDAAGNVYVAEIGNQRIEKFDSAGNWERAWGKDVDASRPGTGFEICTVAANCKAGATGTLGGEFYDPNGVAVDAAGNVYVAEFSNLRIQKFGSAGNFERAWGEDVDGTGPGTGFEICTVAANCKAGGPLATLGGSLNSPIGVAVGAGGKVYVAERFGRRISRFDSVGAWERTWGKDVDGTTPNTGFEFCTAAANCKNGDIGGLGGELDEPYFVVADAAGNVYVTDHRNQRIQKFDSAGNFQRAWGKDVDASQPGTGFEICTVAANCKTGDAGGFGGELASPEGVAVDAAGNLYAADGNNWRIQRFDSAGNFQRAWGKDVDAGGGTGFEICTVAPKCRTGDIGGLGGELNTLVGVATDAAGNLYVADSGNMRIQKFAEDKTAPTATLSGKAKQKAGRFVTVVVSCLNEACTASVTGIVNVPGAGAARRFKLGKAAKRIVKGARTTLELKVPENAQQAIKKALRKPKLRNKVKATITLTARDSAGNTTTKRKTILLGR